MTGRRRSTNSKLQQAETLLSLGLSNGEVAARLQCSTRTVRTYAQTLRGDGRIQNPINKGGRPRKITHRLERVLMREAMWGSTNTHGQLVRLLRESYGVKCSKKTVKVTLKHTGVISCKKRKRALLTEKHKQRRLKWARQHQRTPVQEGFNNVCWSDESRVCLYGNDGPGVCFRRRGAPLRDRDVQGVVKHGGGSLMVWGSFTGYGVGKLIRIVGNMNTDKYIRVVGPAIIESMLMNGLDPRTTTFQQDNATPHTSRKTMAWFAEGASKS